MSIGLFGCSYSQMWSNFPGDNFGETGAGNKLIFSKVIEKVENKAVSEVLIGVSFYTRRCLYSISDSAFCSSARSKIVEKHYHYCWGMTNSENNILTLIYEMFLDIFLLTGYLKQKNIKYLIFNNCNNFNGQLEDKKVLDENLKYFKQLDDLVQLVNADPGVVDLFNFCANEHLFANGAVPSKVDVCNQYPPNQIHYEKGQNEILLPYFRQHSKKHNLELELERR